MTETDGGILHDCDLYLQVNHFPGKRDYYSKDTHGVGVDADLTVNATAERGVWYIGVYGFLGCDYALTMTTESECDCSGHGSCNLNGVCQCAPGWGSDDCSISNRTLISNTPVAGTLERRQWDYFYFDVSSTREAFTLTMDSAHDCDLYLRQNQFPSLFRFDAVNASVPAPNQPDHSTLQLEEPKAGRWYVGIYGFEESDYTLTLTTADFAGNVCPNNCSLHGTCNNGRCDCPALFGGQSCEYHLNDLILSQSMNGFVDAGQWNYFSISTQTSSNLIVSAQENASLTPNGDCDLYVKSGSYPNRTSFDFADLGFGSSMRIQIDSPGFAHFYIGVYGWTQCAFSLTTSEETVAQDCHNGQVDANGACICNPGYFGEDCEDQAVALTQAAPALTGSVAMGSWVYYSFTAEASSFVFVLKETSGSSGNLWLYVNENTAPTEQDNLDVNDEQSAIHAIHFNAEESKSHTFVVGVFGAPFEGEDFSTTFKISAFAFGK